MRTSAIVVCLVAAVASSTGCAFYRLERDEPKSQRFAIDALVLPERGKYRLRVYPRNCFGDCGAPISSGVMESKPGKASAPIWKTA